MNMWQWYLYKCCIFIKWIFWKGPQLWVYRKFFPNTNFKLYRKSHYGRRVKLRGEYFFIDALLIRIINKLNNELDIMTTGCCQGGLQPNCKGSKKEDKGYIIIWESLDKFISIVGQLPGVSYEKWDKHSEGGFEGYTNSGSINFPTHLIGEIENKLGITY
jgi:hypothetical protein